MKKISISLLPFSYFSSVLAQNKFPESGDVGIGTISPSSPLNIVEAGTANSVDRFIEVLNSTQGGTGLGASIDFVHRSTANANRTSGRIVSINENDFNGSFNNEAGMAFYTLEDATSVERLRIKHNGNVGIGISDPKQKLQVAGTIYSKRSKS
ncbi:MAG: hypothetical protein AAF620_10710 [Bacteroidota bacterium]